MVGVEHKLEPYTQIESTKTKKKRCLPYGLGSSEGNVCEIVEGK